MCCHYLYMKYVQVKFHFLVCTRQNFSVELTAFLKYISRSLNEHKWPIPGYFKKVISYRAEASYTWQEFFTGRWFLVQL